MAFSAKEWAILTVLRHSPRPVTTNYIADEVSVSWHTANRTLTKLFERGYVRRGVSPGGTTYWKLVR